METRVIVKINTDGKYCSVCDFYEEGKPASDASTVCNLFSSDLYRGECCDECIKASSDLESIERELRFANKTLAKRGDIQRW